MLAYWYFIISENGKKKIISISVIDSYKLSYTKITFVVVFNVQLFFFS